MRYSATVLVLLAAAVSAPAIAADPKPAAPEAEAKKEAKADKKICRRISDMGSRRTKRVCMTRKEWERFNNGN